MRFLSIAALSVVTLAGIGALWVEDSRGASEHRFMRLPDRTSPYSDAVLVGDILYLAGDIGIDPKTGPPRRESRADLPASTGPG